jgi:hypothetical protein
MFMEFWCDLWFFCVQLRHSAAVRSNGLSFYFYRKMTLREWLLQHHSKKDNILKQSETGHVFFRSMFFCLIYFLHLQYKMVIKNLLFHLTGSVRTKLQGVCGAKCSYFCWLTRCVLCMQLHLVSRFWLGSLQGNAGSLTLTHGTNESNSLRQLQLLRIIEVAKPVQNERSI